MRVIISAGGTGGHIYPALAIINKIKEKEPSEFLYIGTHNRMEKDIVPKKNIPFEAIEMYGFDRKHLLNNVKTVKCLLKANKKCKKIIKDFNPDIVIGVGGYVTVPVIKNAKKLGYKTAIHEQNSLPGKANLMLSKYSDLVFLSFESSKKYFKNKHLILSGNPCSEQAKKSEKVSKKIYGLSDDKKLVIFVMGSLGAQKINEIVLTNAELFKNKDYEVLFITGKRDYEKYNKINYPKNFKVIEFCDNLTGLMKSADFIVSRAGASTLSEIVALQMPSLLIPSPNVTDNHQYKNALDLSSKGASILIEEKDFTIDRLIKEIDKILANPDEIKKIKNNLKSFDMGDSAQIIYDEIKKIWGRKLLIFLL